MGQRVRLMRAALKRLRDVGAVRATSRLYETRPMYVEDQPKFLNAVCRLETELSATELLEQLKGIEESLGRDTEYAAEKRFGPRPIDMDILLYDSDEIADGRDSQGRALQVPHPRMCERRFVLEPLVDLAPDLVVPGTGRDVASLLGDLRGGVGPGGGGAGDAAEDGAGEDLYPVFPAGGDALWPCDRTYVMGILNVTPDSFSDGGSYDTVGKAVETALRLVRDGADIIDIGGESTRPGAEEVRIEEEIERVAPVIEALRGASDVPISVDTRKAAVAEAAVEAGATVINDVSGGEFDDRMLPLAAELGVPIVLMHMRGTPKTMQQLTRYDDVSAEVRSTLLAQAAKAQRHGVPAWDVMLDPGIGFAKEFGQNLELLGNLRAYAGRGADGAAGVDAQARHLSHVPFPLLIGASRKGFIGKLTGEDNARDRDWGSLGAACAAMAGGARVLRVHNVKATKQAAVVWDAAMRTAR